jgi:hypothetical protein
LVVAEVRERLAVSKQADKEMIWGDKISVN